MGKKKLGGSKWVEFGDFCAVGRGSVGQWVVGQRGSGSSGSWVNRGDPLPALVESNLKIFIFKSNKTFAFRTIL